jgi:fumarylacetoacetate (FAA) hydrolase
MILATIDATPSNPDGTLCVVHPNRTIVALPPEGFIDSSRSLREALDNWSITERFLKEVHSALVRGETNGLDIIAAQDCSFSAPLPRSWGFLDGSAFIQHVKLARKARGADLPAELESVPLMYQGVSDNLLGPHDDIPLRDITDGLDFESEIGVIVDSVPRGTTAKEAGKHVKLVVLLNDISLRSLIPREVGTGFGFVQSKPPSAFAPFAVTPDELGAAWKDGRLHLPVKTTLNGEIIGSPNAGEMFFSFNQLIEHAVATRSLSAGTIIGSGTVSNEDSHVGSGCLAERRMLEQIASGSVTTPWLTEGDTVSISVHQDGVDLFGTINQTVRKI